MVLAGHGSARGQAATLAVTGPYRFVRNPIYLAGITLLAGIGLLYGPWHADDLVLPVVLFVFFHLAVLRVEEPALRSQFGGSYGAYCRRVVPPPWCGRGVCFAHLNRRTDGGRLTRRTALNCRSFSNRLARTEDLARLAGSDS